MEDEGLQSREIRRKYRRWKKVEPEDLEGVIVFRDLHRAKIRLRDGEMYARILRMTPFDVDQPIAYGWIPNDSGKATTISNIESCIGHSEPDEEFRLLTELYEDDVLPSIAASPIAHPEIVIVPCDGRGVCLIEMIGGNDSEDIGERQDLKPSIVVDMFWNSICRRLGDPMGSAMGCTAMERPFRRDPSTYVYEGIAEEYLSYLHRLTLYTEYNVSVGWTFGRSERKSRYDANIAYLERYLSLYSQELSVMMEDYLSRKRFATSINNALEEFISRKYRVRVDRTMVLIGAITLLATVVISAAGYL